VVGVVVVGWLGLLNEQRLWVVVVVVVVVSFVLSLCGIEINCLIKI